MCIRDRFLSWSRFELRCFQILGWANFKNHLRKISAPTEEKCAPTANDTRKKGREAKSPSYFYYYFNGLLWTYTTTYNNAQNTHPCTQKRREKILPNVDFSCYIQRWKRNFKIHTLSFLVWFKISSLSIAFVFSCLHLFSIFIYIMCWGFFGFL